MESNTKNIIDVIFDAAQLLVLLIVTAFAYVRFFREGTHSPRTEFDIDCSFLGPQGDHYVATFVICARNRGHVEHRFHRIGLRVLGIKAGEPLRALAGHEPLLAFPEKVVKIENIIPADFGYFFVRPGVEQKFSVVVPVPTGYSFLIARATFKYQATGDLHTAERAFQVRPAEEAKG